MKIKVLLISSLLLLSLFTLNSHSQDSYSGSARAERAAWAANSNAGVLNTPIHGNDSSRATTPNQAENPVPNQTRTAIPAVSNVSNYTSPRQIETISIPGNWSLEIADNVSRNATLTLFQNGDTIFGKGRIREDNNTLTVAAGGIITGNKLDLNLITLEKMGLYRLSMTVSEDSAIGSYTAFSTVGSPSTGPVKGLRT
jgi:hypothetical protein